MQGTDWTVVYNQDFAPLFEEMKVTCFADIYDLAGGTTVKKQQDRSVLRFEMVDSVFFLKRHEDEERQGGGVLTGTSYTWCSEGGKEFGFFHAFRQHALATATPVAMGERICVNGMVQSFLLTEDFLPYIQLEEVIRHAPEQLAGQSHLEKRLNILRAVGRYARQMHRAGFNHQDFNATHVLLHGVEKGVPDMALFDLQRVAQNPWQKFRWPIKALAEFNYSSRENNVFSDGERFFLFQVYCNKVDRPLSIAEKLQWRWIKGKTKRIARHTAKRHARNRKRQ